MVIRKLYFIITVSVSAVTAVDFYLFITFIDDNAFIVLIIIIYQINLVINIAI